jgi:hypothetical protein
MILDIDDGKSKTRLPSVAYIEEVVDEKDVIDVTVIPEDDTDDIDDGNDNDVDIDYFEIFVNRRLIRTLYRYRRRGNRFGIGSIQIRKGDSIYWKYYQDGSLIKISRTIVLDGNTRKELIVLYQELMYIYRSGEFDYEDNDD